MDTSSALEHLASAVSSLEGPTLEAWPAQPDGDTSEGSATLVDVDSPLGFTVVVIEPPTGLTFVALATGESHDHCMLPYLESQWSALFEQPYEKVPRSKGIRLTDGILRDNHTLGVLAAQMESSAAITPDKANQLWEGPLGHKMIDWCYVNATCDPLASDRLRLWIWAVAGIGVTKPEGSVHKGQIYYRCYKHLSEANGLRYVMGVPLIVEPERRMFSPAAAPAAVSALTSLRNQAEPTQISCHPGHIKMLRDILAPGALGAWVSKDSHLDPQGWQKNLLNRVIDACRAVPDASVPADLLESEPIITGSLELVMQSVVNLLAEAIEKLKSMEKAAHAHNSALATASAAATFERKQAVEDARSKVANLWGSEQILHKEKVKELEARVTSQATEIQALKVQISNTSSDFKSVSTEKEVAVNSARAELQERHDSENAALCMLVKKMADHLQVSLPKWGGGTSGRGSASKSGAVPAPEPAIGKPSFPEDLTVKEKVQKCLSKWAEYFKDHALRVDRYDLKKIMSLPGMMEAHKALQCPGQCLKCAGKISLYAMPHPEGQFKCVQHLDSTGIPDGVRPGECSLEGAHSCPLCEGIAFVDCNHCVSMCPLKSDKVAALVGNSLTFGYVTSAACTEKAKAAKKAKREEQEKRDSESQPSYDQQDFDKAWQRKDSGPKGPKTGRQATSKGGQQASSARNKQKKKKPVPNRTESNGRPTKRARSEDGSA